ncbi:MAG: TetR/AcrR family transcriptional regulator [Phycisphaeraceae bacterium]|nr:TetR/AcrR family transcriptional regulator [Phycisphaeraceae bacterium]
MATGRPREFDRDAALLSAMDVFWRQGFEGTQVEDLLGAMGIGRGSMYAAFGDKRSLYLEALEAFTDRITRWYRQRLLDGGGSALERLRGVIRAWPDFVERGCGKGCFLSNSLIERAAVDEDVARIVTRTLRAEELLIRGVLSEAQGMGELAAERDVGMLAKAIVNARLGVTLQARLGAPREGAEAAASAMLEILR